MPLGESGAAFPRTRWSVVLRTRSPQDEAVAQAALAELCRTYWPPLYAFARRSGYSPHDAEDLTQGFLARVLEKNVLSSADPARGRLRSFLLGAFQHFMVQEWRYEHREKRGGHQAPIAIDAGHAEEAFEPAASPQLSPAELFERRWFETVLERALDDLRGEYALRGRAPVFERLHEHLAWNSGAARLEEVARELGMTCGALRVAIYRLRKRYRELVEQHIADTVGSPAEVEEELLRLRRAMAG